MSGCVWVYFLPYSSTCLVTLTTCLVTLTSCLTKVTDGQAYFGSQLKTHPVLGKLWNQELEAAPSIRKQSAVNVCAELAFTFYIVRTPAKGCPHLKWVSIIVLRKISLRSDSKSHQVDQEDKPSHPPKLSALMKALFGEPVGSLVL